MIVRRFPAAIAVLALTLAGCGARLEGADGARAAVPATGAISDATDTGGQGGTSPASGPTADGNGTSAARGSGGTTADPVVWPSGPGKDNTLPLEVTLSAECVQPGSTLSATAAAVKGARLAFATRYSDNDFVPDIKYVPGEANPTGTFTWTWQITPTHPRGDAGVIVVAAKGDRGASYDAPFLIADRC